MARSLEHEFARIESFRAKARIRKIRAGDRVVVEVERFIAALVLMGEFEAMEQVKKILAEKKEVTREAE